MQGTKHCFWTRNSSRHRLSGAMSVKYTPPTQEHSHPARFSFLPFSPRARNESRINCISAQVISTIHIFLYYFQHFPKAESDQYFHVAHGAPVGPVSSLPIGMPLCGNASTSLPGLVPPATMLPIGRTAAVNFGAGTSPFTVASCSIRFCSSSSLPANIFGPSMSRMAPMASPA